MATKQAKLSDVKIRCEVWIWPADEKRVTRARKPSRKTRAAWMYEAVLEKLAREEKALAREKESATG